MSHTYRFDVSVCIGPISSLLTSANHSKTFCMLRTRDARIQLNGLENFSFSYDCLTRVLKRFQDMCMSTKRRVCTNLLFGLGYSMIESVKKLHRRLFCKNGTGSNIRSSRASLLPWNLQAVMAAPDASRTGWARARAQLIGADAQQRHPSLPTVGGRHSQIAQLRGQGRAAGRAATARAQGLGRAGKSARQAPQDGYILPPQHLLHNLAEGSVMGL